MMKKTKWLPVLLTVVLFTGCNLYSENNDEEASLKTIYTEEYQNNLAKQIEAEKNSDDYDEDNMMIKHNPFGINVQSLCLF